MTLKYNQGHWNWYEWAKLSEYYHHENLTFGMFIVSKKIMTLKLLIHRPAGRPNTDHYKDWHFSCEPKWSHCKSGIKTIIPKFLRESVLNPLNAETSLNVTLEPRFHWLDRLSRASTSFHLASTIAMIKLRLNVNVPLAKPGKCSFDHSIPRCFYEQFALWSSKIGQYKTKCKCSRKVLFFMPQTLQN